MSQTLNINYDPYAPGTFALTFTVNGVAPNLSTGYGATMRIWRSGLPTTASPDVTVTAPGAIALGTSGSIILDLVVIHTALALVSSTEAVWSYDLIVTPTGAYSQKVCSGQLAEGVGSDAEADVSAPISVNWAGTVGGDLSGTLPNPTVDGLQGRAVAATAPTNGQVLAWNSTSSQWEPTTGGGGGGVTSLTGTANEVEVSASTGAVTVGLPDEVTVVDLNTDRVDFNTTPASTTAAVGRHVWDSTWETLSLGMDGGVSLKHGQQLFLRGHNSTGTQIDRGKVVYVSGGHATTEALIALADADAESTSAYTVGIAAEDIAHGSTGFVQVFGYMASLVTNGYSGAEGSALYLSSTAGDMTSTLPTQPKHGFRVGILVKKSAAGSIFVSPQNYQELEELSDVLVSGLAEKDLLSWDNTAGVWKNRTLANAGVAAASHTHAASDIVSGVLATARLASSGTADATTFLRGDQTWSTVAAGSTVTISENTYTSSGTWTKPTGCQYIVVEACGAGGGGGSGSGASSGGAGGCGGLYGQFVIPVSLLTASTCDVTVGTGGTAGNDGGDTSMNVALASTNLFLLNGGRGASNASYSIIGTAATNGFAAGGAAGTNGGRHGGYGPAGGGGGGNAASGGAGGRACSLEYAATGNVAAAGGGAAGGTAGNAGTTATTTIRGFGDGGGGGGGASTTAGGNGGNGTRGSGGGGGGGGTPVGTGGTGGDGFVRIISVSVT